MTDDDTKPSNAVPISFLSFGFVFVAIAVLINGKESLSLLSGDLLINLGAAFIATAGITWLYQKLGVKDLIDRLKWIQKDINEKMQKFYNEAGLLRKAIEIGIVDIWIERKQIDTPMWNKFTGIAAKEVWLFGVAEYEYAMDLDFEKIISDGTARGCDFKILLLDESSKLARYWDEPESSSIVSSKIRSAIEKFRQMAEKNENNEGKIELKVYDDVPSMSIVRSDGEMLVTLFIPTFRRENSPTFRFREIDSGMFSHYEKHFKKIWDGAKQIKSSR